MSYEVPEKIMSLLYRWVSSLQLFEPKVVVGTWRVRAICHKNTARDSQKNYHLLEKSFCFFHSLLTVFGVFCQPSQQGFHTNSETHPAFLKHASHQPAYSYKMPLPTILKGHTYITILIFSLSHLTNFLFIEKGIPCSWADSIEQTLLMLLWTWSSWNVFPVLCPTLLSSQDGFIPLELNQKEKKKENTRMLQRYNLSPKCYRSETKRGIPEIYSILNWIPNLIPEVRPPLKPPAYYDSHIKQFSTVTQNGVSPFPYFTRSFVEKRMQNKLQDQNL